MRRALVWTSWSVRQLGVLAGFSVAMLLTMGVVFTVKGDAMAASLSALGASNLLLAGWVSRLTRRVHALEDGRQLRLDIGFSMLSGLQPEFRPPEPSGKAPAN